MEWWNNGIIKTHYSVTPIFQYSNWDAPCFAAVKLRRVEVPSVSDHQ